MRFVPLVLLALGLWSIPAASAAAPEQPWILSGAPSFYAGLPAPILGYDRVRPLQEDDFRADSPSARAWQILVKLLRFQNGENQLRLVNQFINSQKYKDDFSLYRRNDHWATVAEFMEKGGDCEDYAIAKFRALLAAGVPEQNMRILVVEDQGLRLPHAILAVRLGKRTLILDNQTPQISPYQEKSGYRLLYSFNTAGLWVHQRDLAPLTTLTDLTTTRR